MKKRMLECKTFEAEVVEKKVLPFVDIAGNRGIPVPDPVYQIIMETPEGKMELNVSEFEFEVLEIGDKGCLKAGIYKHYNELISFGDKIFEVKDL